MKNLLLLFFGILGLSTSYCQVSNNAIENRIVLSLNDPWFSSSTRNASVEWDCINKVLTSTCLVYHNDQWFTIIPPATGTYYINIANQKCSNQQGVQIVVLEGDPCKVDSYQLKMCISYTDQSDMFVQIDSLIGGKEYLLNIDGYLGDQCEFEIQFSTSKNGIPIQARNMNSVELRVASRDTIVSLQWNIPDSLIFKISHVSLYRKHEKEKAARHIYNSALRRNAFGETESTYSTLDTLSKKGQYTYSMYGYAPDGSVVLLTREDFLFRAKDRGSSKVKHRANIDFVSPKSGNVTVNVFDSAIEKPLFSTSRRIVKGRNKLVLDLSDYVSDGVMFYKIVISDKTFRQEHYYKIKRSLK
jgi:hypothetical protein